MNGRLELRKGGDWRTGDGRGGTRITCHLIADRLPGAAMPIREGRRAMAASATGSRRERSAAARGVWRSDSLPSPGLPGQFDVCRSNSPCELGRPIEHERAFTPHSRTTNVERTPHSRTMNRMACSFSFFLLCLTDGRAIGWSVDHPDHPLDPPLNKSNL